VAALAALKVRLAAARSAAARHPRHVVLAAIVAGLMAGAMRQPLVALALVAVAPLAGPGPVLALGAAAGAVGGATVADLRLESLERTSLRPALGREVRVRAVLLEEPRRRAFGATVAPAELRAVEPGGGPRALERAPGGQRRGGGAGDRGGRGGESAAGIAAEGERVLLRVARRRWGPTSGWPEPAIGAEVVARGRLEALGRFERRERRRGAHGLLRVDALRTTGWRRGGLSGALDRVRTRAQAALARGLGARDAALARGMVLGQDEALGEAVREEFRATGLAHLVAASGTNVALLATLVLGVTTAAGMGLTPRLLLALAAVAAYVPLAGGGPSIQRAGVMGAAMLVAALAGRQASRWYAVLLAAALTLARDPRMVGDEGWQLSFAAVLALLTVAPPLRRWLTTWGRRSAEGAAHIAPARGGQPARGVVARVVGVRLARALRGRAPHGLPGPVADALALSLAATLGTAPLIALHFERFSLVSVPVNLLALPAVAPVMWLGSAAAASGSLLPATAEVLGWLNALPLGYLGWLAHAGAGVPGAELDLALPHPLAAAGAYALLALVVLVRPARRAATGLAAAVALAGILAAAALGPRALGRLLAGAPPTPRGLVVAFLDVGQGDATLLRHGEHAVLVDAGPPDGPVLRRLREAGVRRLDALVLTHASADHDGGAAAVLRTHPTRLLLDGGDPGHRTPGLRRASALARARGVRRMATDAGQVVRLGPLELRVLWPDRDAPAASGADPNLRATVLHVRDGPFDLLLSADAESPVTTALRPPRVDAVKVAHHGSEDPGLPALLERLRPRVAIIPVGHNSYGHPHPRTLRDLRAVPVVRRTDRHGTVRLSVAGRRISVTTQR